MRHIGIIKACNNFYNLTVVAKQKPIYMYHGTSINNLPSILSQGLIIDSKQKVWQTDADASFNRPSRASVGGIYFTKNLVTAISSGGNATKNNKKEIIVIIAEIKPGSIFADEDTVPSAISIVKMPEATVNESISCYLWAYLNTDPNNLDLITAKNLYIDNCIKSINQQLEYNEFSKLHPKLQERLIEIFNEGFSTALERQVSHVDSYWYKSAIERVLGRDAEIEQPNKNESEQKYSKYINKVTKVLRLFAISEISRGYGLKSSRIEQNIGYSGGNKIVGIVKINRQNDALELIYEPPDGMPTEAINDFMEQYRQYKGSDAKLISKVAAY